ncbi:hypothetical protein [Pseudalkalibacillus hwajinpoensis]|uniref:hypothetical protein n=1 Tax=Guptibacillus hwajinpoensis TaxID=208199 RepID=UPI001CD4A487|nr:hypothetical protein [Pseudalkalibacillus hwajinpoensis]MCA0993255.1 hypothetical protein [Pseudalkalibacillus hwajinpoensis]
MRFNRKAEWARLNPQDVGALSNETLFVSIERAKQPEDLAHAARHEKRRRAFRNGDIGVLELEHAFGVLVKERNIAVSASRS